MTMVCRTRVRHSAPGLTRAKLDSIRELAASATRARQLFVRRYWREEFVGLILTRPRVLVEECRDAGALRQPGLNVQLSKLALEEALALLKGHWAITLRATRRALAGLRLGTADRAWCSAVLSSPDAIDAMLAGRFDDLPAPSGIDRVRLARRLARLMRASRRRPPRAFRTEWVQLDTNLYRPFQRSDDRTFRGAWVAISGPELRRRIAIPLAGSGLSEFVPRTSKPKSLPNVRLSVEGDRVVFRLVERVFAPARTGTEAVGVDKGYNTLLVASSGDATAARAYGAGAGFDAGVLAADSIDRVRSRRQLRAHQRSLLTSDAPRAARVTRNNLGAKKLLRRARRDRAQTTQAIGRALNSFFAENREVAVIYAESLDFFRRRLSRRMNQRVGRWMKGHLQRALAHKARLHGVQLYVVNAAYTSLTCPSCGYPSKRNRSGQTFFCRSCAYRADADAVAATNVLFRGRDPDISRWTSAADVYRILNERWRSALTGGAWSSNESADGAGVRSSEQPDVTRGQIRTFDERIHPRVGPDLLGRLAAAGEGGSEPRIADPESVKRSFALSFCSEHEPRG